MACSLRWRQGKLWVSAMVSGRDVPLPALASEVWFQACLARSQATAVCIDLDLGRVVIDLWAKACEGAQKPLYLRIPGLPNPPKNQHPTAWRIKRLGDLVAAVLLLIGLSPLLLLLAALIKLENQGPVFETQWRVGERGKLFRLYRFRSTVIDADTRPLRDRYGATEQSFEGRDVKVTVLGKWMRKRKIDHLPQLINVLRGEMSLVGPRPWSICAVVREPPALRARFNILPGITGSMTMAGAASSNQQCVIPCNDLAYISHWTLLKDVKILALMAPREVMGIGLANVSRP